jgi:hypothetical protein
LLASTYAEKRGSTTMACGTEAAGLAPGHRGSDAAGFRLVAGRQHDARTDDDRAAAQPRIVSLLDRGEERIDVRVQDRPFAGHEHMFASWQLDGQRALMYITV